MTTRPECTPARPAARSQRLRPACGWLATVAFALPACTSSQATGTEEIALPDPLPVVTAESRLPYQDVTLSGEDMTRLMDAYNELVRACAANYGVDLTMVSEAPETFGEDSKMWKGTFGALPLEHAQQYGYHAAPGEPSTTTFTVFVREDEQPQHGVLEGMYEDGEERVLDAAGNPVPEGGCRGEISDQIGGNPTRLAPADSEELRLAALHDPRTEKAMTAWSECMREAGYRFSAIDEPADLALGSPISDEEKQVAVADVLCTRSSHWLDISFAIQKALQDRSIDQHGAEYENKLKQAHQMLDRATALAGAVS